ncbi:hypothetical protein [Campylobacter ureolyticus]|uniref:Membrane protein n=1 Tax=Campylobacter ureolyticus TaxID=827 RepID=A0AAE7EBA3_9BACT|nr:hypothetical protein [Campylobacter ureolyticus]MCR8685368.1 hypothetical protein [Campylobacter ureolyticus]QKF85049.1 putative membrane protein [Campylobacter ureolyticus]QQY36459.1 hypothetical protein I6I59_04360 [Campylobacter ureolyticus]SUX19879.1 Uncharacterised protein [Campylobacter ureolyticus]
MSKPIYEEVIDEIGTQTLARVGLNIFSFSTYNAYGASVTMTNNTIYQHDRKKGMLTPELKDDDTDKTYDQKLKKGKSTYRGYMYETLEEGFQNVNNAFLNKGDKTYTTDTIHDIRNAAELIKDRKKLEKLNEEDRAKFDHIMRNYSDEVDDVLNGNDNFGSFTKCDTETDLVTYDEDGNIVNRQQLKASNNTKVLLAKEQTPELDENGNEIKIPKRDKDGNFKRDKNGNICYRKKMTDKLDKNGNPIYKYIGKDEFGNDKDIDLKVPFDDYKRHRENLEEMINDPKTDPETKKAAKMALDKLNKSNYANRLMCDNPKTTAILTQSAVASSHIVSVGTSDGVVVALSTLANGTIYEIKDMFSENGEKISITQRLKRLIKKVIEAFKSTFKRGAGFGSIDAIVGVLSQIFKSISVKIKYIWKNLRSSAKSIYNAIYDFITGKTKTYRDLVSAIIKALFSFTTIISSIGLEAKIEAVLSPIITPMIASFVAPILAIVVGAFAVVLGTRAIDSAINSLFGVYADLIKSRERRAEIEKVIDEFLPQLVEDNEKLETLIKTKFKDMKLKLDSSFEDLQNAIIGSNSILFINSLVQINGVYGQKLKYISFKEFDQAMLSDNVIKI